MPAITLSTLPSPSDPARNSILDLPSALDEDELIDNIRLIGEAVLGYILDLPESGPSSDSRVKSEATMLSKDAVDKQRVHHFIRQFASRPRPVGDQRATESITSNLASVAAGYGNVFKSAVTITDAKAFGVTQNRLVAERVKPAVFELVIAAGVFTYLSAFYYVRICSIQFPSITILLTDCYPLAEHYRGNSSSHSQIDLLKHLNSLFCCSLLNIVV